MKSYRIPNTDLNVSRVAYGCANLAGWDHNALNAADKTRAEHLIHTALEQGITLFDHADLYAFGKSETLFGHVMRDSPGLRDRLVLQSKCGQVLSSDFHWGKPIYVDLSRQHIQHSVAGTLRRLGTDYLDILLLHAPSTLVRPDEIAEAFDALHRDGKVRFFGVSNYSPAQLELIRTSVSRPIVVNQIHLGIGHPDAFVSGTEFTLELAKSGSTGHSIRPCAYGILDYCRVHDIQIQAWSPVRGDLINLKDDSSPELKRLADHLAETARQKNTTPAGLSLAWLMHHPAGILPITGSGTAEHIIENCAAERVTLSDTEWYSLLTSAVDLHYGTRGQEL